MSPSEEQQSLAGDIEPDETTPVTHLIAAVSEGNREQQRQHQQEYAARPFDATGGEVVGAELSEVLLEDNHEETPFSGGHVLPRGDVELQDSPKTSARPSRASSLTWANSETDLGEEETSVCAGSAGFACHCITCGNIA